MEADEYKANGQSNTVELLRVDDDVDDDDGMHSHSTRQLIHPFTDR